MATQAQLLDGEAFNQLVLEEGLKTWEQDGYVYAGKRGTNGWELYRAYGPKWRWFYQGRRVLTSPAGGGVLHINLTVPAGCVFRLSTLQAIGAASAGATLNIYTTDEDGSTIVPLAAIAAGVSRVTNLTYPGGSSTTHNANSTSDGMLLGPGVTVKIVSSTSLATETLTVYVSGIMPTNTELVWSTTGSVAGATLAASTISAANTLQAVMLPCP